MAKSVFSGGFSTVAVEIPSCFCSISGFCHGCLENWRTPLGHDKMNRLGGRGGTVLWACFPLASWICHNCWLHQALTWIKRVIFHWWLVGLMPPSISPAIPISCSHRLCLYFYLLPVIAVLLSFLSVIYGEATHPLLPLAPDSNATARPAALPNPGVNYFQYGATHQCLLSVYNK